MEFDIEMPTPCQHCGVIFDLDDGVGSESWYPGTVICETCADIEQSEIEVLDYIQMCELEIEDAKWQIKHSERELEANKVILANLEQKKQNSFRSKI
jgi:hypothetical protein